MWPLLCFPFWIDLAPKKLKFNPHLCWIKYSIIVTFIVLNLPIIRTPKYLGYWKSLLLTNGTDSDEMPHWWQYRDISFGSVLFARTAVLRIKWFLKYHHLTWASHDSEFVDIPKCVLRIINGQCKRPLVWPSDNGVDPGTATWMGRIRINAVCSWNPPDMDLPPPLPSKCSFTCSIVLDWTIIHSGSTSVDERL